MQERVTEVGAGVRDWIGNWPWQLLGRCTQHCTFAAVTEALTGTERSWSASLTSTSMCVCL